MKKIAIIFTAVILSIPIFTFAQGCMEASSDEGVNVVGYLQAQYEYMFGKDEDTNEFAFNRARMGLVGNIPYDFSYYVMFEFSPSKEGAPYLLDGFITYSRLAPWANFSLGQFKSPFSLELNTPCQGLHTIRRSTVVNELSSPDRDQGLMITGKYEKMFKYALAFTNGTGRGMPEDNNNKTIHARMVFSPIEYVSLGGSYRTGKYPPVDNTVDEEDERTRMAGELEVKYDNFLVQAEYITAEDIGSYTTGGG